MSPFFIVGSQRSGSTLMRLLLNAHSKIAIPEEGTFWMPLLKRAARRHSSGIITQGQLGRYLKYIESNNQFRLWGIDAEEVLKRIRETRKYCTVPQLISEFYEYYAEQQDKFRWGDKTPSFFRMIPVLAGLYPDARFVHVVRDGRDVYLSWRKMDSSRKNLSVAALEWVYKVKTVQKGFMRLTPERQFSVRYEDLVTNPKRWLGLTCDFLGIDYEPQMLDFWKTSDQFIGSHHSRLIFRPVTSVSVRKWEDELSGKELAKFEFFAGSALKLFKYELSGKAGEPRASVSALFELVRGLPLRGIQVFSTALNLHISSMLGLSTDAAGKGRPPEKKAEKP
jgi:hypothetical protein